MSNPLLRINRSQLEKIIGDDPAAIRAFEELFKQSDVEGGPVGEASEDDTPYSRENAGWVGAPLKGDVALNTTHKGSDGSDHSKVEANETASGLNTTHRSSDGKDHSDVVINNDKVTNATHTEEVTGSGALIVSDNVIDEANLKLDVDPTNGFIMAADDTESGGMKWVDLSLENGGTVIPSVPVLRVEGAYKGFLVRVSKQPLLSNFARYEFQVSADEVNAYSLEFDGSDWKDILNEDTDFTDEWLFHTPLPPGGTEAVPLPLELSYRVRRVTIDEVASDWTAWVSAINELIGEGDISQASISTDKLVSQAVTAAKIETDTITAAQVHTDTLSALFAKVVYALTIGFSGTGDESAPNAGDKRIYIDADEFRIQKGNNAHEWENRARLALRSGGNVADFVLSGFFQAGESLLSSPGLIWVERTGPFGGSHIFGIAYGNGVWIAAGPSGKIARSTDNAEAWGSLITNPFGASSIGDITFGNGVWIAVGASGKLARSTDDGVTWGSLITTPFGTSYIEGVAYGNGVWIAVAAGGKIARSLNNGATWGSLIINPFGTDPIFGIAYGNDVWIAVADQGKIARSIDDGITWGSLITNPFSTTAILNVAYGDGVWITVAVGGKIARSKDKGLTWGSLITNPFSTSPIYGIAYGDGLWVAVAHNGKIARSTDGGLTWGAKVYGDAEVSQPFGTDGFFYATAYSNDKQRWALCGYLDSTNDGIIATSDWLEAGAGIVEQGSNSNGEYVWFSNGTQICWNSETGLNANVSKSGDFGSGAGAIYRAGNTTTFPAAFISPPTIGMVPTNVLISSVGIVTTTTFSLIVGFKSSITTATADWIAIGRWK